MRHFRLPAGNNAKNINSFEKQMEILLKQIDKFNDKEKHAAYDYIRKRVNGHSSTERKPKPKKNSAALLKKQRKKLCMKKIEGFSVKPPKRILQSLAVKPALLKCRICSITKRSKLKFLQHLKTHVGTPISCNKCKSSFNNRISYDFHLNHTCNRNLTVKSKRFKCGECSKTFNFQRHYWQHLESHKRNNCPYCEVMLTRRQDLVQHMLKEHSIKLQTAMHKCDICEKRYVKKHCLYYHMRQHAEGKQVCLECGHFSDTVEEHKSHIEKHEKLKRWKCPKCGDKFVRKQQYDTHMKRHDTYKCVSCNESYASKEKALRHKQRGHVVEGLHAKMLCPYCDKAFHRSYNLQLHLKHNHQPAENKSSIPCRYCNKTFKSPYQYFKHCTTINHEKKCPDLTHLMCETCGKKFTKKYLLEQHEQLVHSNTKQPLACEFCDYKTQNLNNLMRHRDLHLNIGKTFICDQCGKEFPSSASLRDHISYNHIQEKIFKCEQCGKAFKRNSELVRHSATHSNICPYTCQLCNAAFKRTSHLRRHEMLVHKLTSKTRKVQRLEMDSNGIFVPIIDTKKNGVKQSQPEYSTVSVSAPIISDSQQDNFVDVTMQPLQTIDYLNIPVNHINDISMGKNLNSNIINVDPMEDYNQTDYWNDKLNLPKTSNLYPADNGMLPQIQGNDLQALNIVNQLVNSFLPDKSLQIPQDSLYDDYANQALQYGNVGLPNAVTSEIITTTEKILQGQCDSRDVMLDAPLCADYMQPYQYMQ